jgi:hypothetical protein
MCHINAGVEFIKVRQWRFRGRWGGSLVTGFGGCKCGLGYRFECECENVDCLEEVGCKIGYGKIARLLPLSGGITLQVKKVCLQVP